MNIQEARELIQVRFLASSIFSASAIALDNQKFTPPDARTAWARLTIQANDGNQETLGRATNRRFVKRGVLFVQVFTITDGATNENDGLVQECLDLFEGVGLSGLYFNNGRIRTIGPTDKYYQQNVVFDFTYYEIK